MHGSLGEIARKSNLSGSTSWPQKTTTQPIVFRDLAKLAFPHKTIEALGHITGASRSTIKYWLNGKHGPDADVLAIVMAEIMRRYATGR